MHNIVIVQSRVNKYYTCVSLFYTYLQRETKKEFILYNIVIYN